MSFKERLNNFPTQLIFTIVWATFGTAASLILSSSILWVALMSVYAICVGHWSAHLSWKAERAVVADSASGSSED